MSAQQPNPGSNSKKAGSLLSELERVKLEGDPLTLNGPSTDASVYGEDPTRPGSVSFGDRLLFRDLSTHKVGLGISNTGDLWLQASMSSYGAGIQFFVGNDLAAPSQVVTIASGGSIASVLGVGTGATSPNSTLEVDGSISLAISSGVTASRNIEAYEYFLEADASGGAVTLTLPAFAAATGRIYVIKRLNAGANAVVVDGNGAETIDGAASKSLDTQYACLVIIAANPISGAGWHVVSTFGTIT
jgi:hypothetical protein